MLYEVSICYIYLPDFYWFGFKLAKYSWKVRTIVAVLAVHTWCECFVQVYGRDSLYWVWSARMIRNLSDLFGVSDYFVYTGWYKFKTRFDRWTRLCAQSELLLDLFKFFDCLFFTRVFAFAAWRPLKKLKPAKGDKRLTIFLFIWVFPSLTWDTLIYLKGRLISLLIHLEGLSFGLG